MVDAPRDVAVGRRLDDHGGGRHHEGRRPVVRVVLADHDAQRNEVLRALVHDRQRARDHQSSPR